MEVRQIEGEVAKGCGIRDVALVVFVRKGIPEIQYLKASITGEQRREYGGEVEATVAQIQSGQFLSHSGIRFPQNGRVSSSHLGLRLDPPELVAANLIRKPGANALDWLDELVDRRKVRSVSRTKPAGGPCRSWEDR